MEKARGLKAILFADIAGYTSLMQRDESLASSFIQKFRAELESLVPNHNGQIINFMGDGCLCLFDSSVKAVESALELQDRFGKQPAIPVRIGIHSGDVYFENDSVFGDSVNVASRIESVGLPGSVLFSDRIYNDIQNHPSFNTQLVGDVQFKNVSRPVKVYALCNEGLHVPDINNIQRMHNKAQSSKWTIYWALALALVTAVAYLIHSYLSSNQESKSLENDVLTVAVLRFENNTGLEEFDVISEISSDRFINGISQFDIARVISGKTIKEYEQIIVESTTASDLLALLSEKFGVNRIVEGQIYRMGTDILMECIITDPNTKEVVMATPSVALTEEDPMKGIEEMREHILSALIVDEDRSRNLLLETKPPHYEAYKMLLAAKEAEDYEGMLILLNKAIEIDSDYFEPKVLRISCYYNMGQFEKADSLTDVLDQRLENADPRQRNLLNFYKALISGENKLIYNLFNEELKLAPFDLMTNNTLMVLATDFINDVQKAIVLYDIIDEEMLDFGNCSDCRTRIYIKMYIDLEVGNYENTLRLGKILSDNGEKSLAEKLRLRAWVRSGKWDELNQYIEDQKLINGTDVGTLSLIVAKECSIVGHKKQFDEYRTVAFQSISQMALDYHKGEIALMSNDYEKAIFHFEKFLSLDNTDIQTLSMLGVAYILDGNTAYGDSLLEMVNQKRKPFQYGDVDYYLATANSIIGNHNVALEHLRSSFAQGQRIGYHGFHNDYWLLPIKDDPRFEEILAYWR